MTMRERHKFCLPAIFALTLAASPASAQDNNSSSKAIIDSVGETAGASLDYVKRLLRMESGGGAESDPFLDEEKRFARHTEVITQMRSGVEETLGLRDEQEAAPVSSFNPLTKTKEDYGEEIGEVLDELEAMLFRGEISNSVDRIDAIRSRQGELRDRIAALREERYAAPNESLWKTTKADIDEDIAQSEEEIEIGSRRIDLLKGKIAVRFEAIGIDLNEAQVDQLLTRVDGTDIIGMTVMIQTVAEMTGVLKTLMLENQGSLEFARRYYGTALVLRELVVHAQDAYIDQVSDLWLPRLDDIGSKLQAAVADDKRQYKAETNETRRSVFANNVEQNNNALEVLAIYRERLKDQQNRVRRARAEAVRDVAAAFSTYKSVSLSSLLIDLVEDSATAFEELMKIQIPEIIPFDDPVLQDKFRELSDELRATS